MRHHLSLSSIAVLLSIMVSSPAVAQTGEPNKTQISEANLPRIALQVTTEENQRTILATVTSGGKPIKGATVAFFVKRTFGNLAIGHDQTLDDGTAAVPFPANLPGGATGNLEVVAAITEPAQYIDARGRATFGGAPIIPLKTEEFSRALWAPQAPLTLILTIGLISLVVWGIYIYIVVQLFRIRKGGNQ